MVNCTACYQSHINTDNQKKTKYIFFQNRHGGNTKVVVHQSHKATTVNRYLQSPHHHSHKQFLPFQTALICEPPGSQFVITVREDQKYLYLEYKTHP